MSDAAGDVAVATSDAGHNAAVAGSSSAAAAAETATIKLVAANDASITLPLADALAHSGLVRDAPLDEGVDVRGGAAAAGACGGGSRR